MTLFDEPFYMRINEARWTAAEKLLGELRDRDVVRLETCLDVGCGPGWFSQRLAVWGLSVEGLDGRAENVAMARRRVPGLRFHRVNIESETEVGALGKFDLVLCFGLLYHTENPFRVVHNLHTLTKGVLFIESIVIPGDAPYAWLVTENPNETQGLSASALIPTRSCLLKMLQCAGFAHVYEYHGGVEHEDFTESAQRHQRRRMFLASSFGLTIVGLEAAPEVSAPKYDFAKT